MISNGTILYGASAAPWEPSEDTLSLIAIGLFTTLLSYQSFSILHLLFLGSARPHVAAPAAMHIHLLLRKCSPLAVLSALTRRDVFTRLYHRHAFSPNTAVARERRTIWPLVSCKLLVLLVAAPLLNMAALVMTLERESVLTFREAGFRGLTFGPVSTSAATHTRRLTELCETPAVDWKPGDVPMAQFSICVGPWVSTHYINSLGRVLVLSFRQREFLVLVRIGRVEVSSARFAVLHANGVKYGLRASMTNESIEHVMDIGLKSIARWCGVPNEPGEPDDGLFLRIGTLLGSKKVPCTQEVDDAEQKSLTILWTLMRHFTIVEAEQLMVAEDSGDFFNGLNLDCLRRRRKNVPFLTLMYLSIGTLVLRIVLAIVWKNGIEEGIERLLKDQLGYSCCSNLLHADERIISFANMYQDGEVAQYGLEREDLPVVDRIRGGVVGGRNVVRPERHF